MKTIKNTALLVSVCVAVLLTAGCDKTDDAGNTSITTDPIEEPKPVTRETFVSRWEIIAEGETEDEMYPVESNGYYTEYLADGKIISYDGSVGKYREKDCIYEVDSEFLYIYFNREEYGTISDRIYKYQFNKDNSELKLTHVEGILLDISPCPLIWVYKRQK